MRINTNVSAIITNNQLSKVQNNLESSLERLSSGYKINHASDDAAGMAISQKMRSQIKGLDQASNNAADGISVIETAEGAISEIQSVLSRMKELAVQAANDVNSDIERAAIQTEINEMNNEIDRISNDTEFNTQALLNGNMARRVYSDVKGVTQLECSGNIDIGKYGILITQDARQAISLGNPITENGFVNDKVTSDMAGNISINGYNIPVKEGEDMNTIISNLMSGCDKVGASVILVDDTTDTTGTDASKAGYKEVSGYTKGVSSFVFVTEQYGSNQKLNITCTNADLAAALGLEDAATETGILKEGLDVKADFALDSAGNRIGFNDSARIITHGTNVSVNDLDEKYFTIDVPGNVAGTVFDDTGSTSVGTTSISKKITQDVTDIGTMTVHVGSNENQVIEIDIPKISTYTIGINKLNLMTQQGASDAILSVDNAIARVSSIRSKLGAYYNRLELTTSNLSVSNDNLTASLSRIIDTDMAEEMTTYTELNVLSQAATSMLSQANARPETVLQILQK